ncbi:acidic mammalian chitinase-like [Gigantopelta aegis]|uniref:acidic mammalian chitinase-like n=1 Tax=Gigantopelta aegis TaxID=1735272 RepID=UPI001B88DFCB|nr:acidic mammalian chitinase-like [Gigantopelta aegis]XP_041364700.1 acidic mammalian chitinase-like [Gigantopelta aegis]
MVSKITISMMLLAVTIAVTEIEADTQYRKVCYFTNWSRWRQGIGKFGPQNVNSFLCTHIVFAFGNFNYSGTLTPFESGYDESDYRALVNKKQQNENLKLLLALGGWNFGSQKFSNMVASTTIRRTFVNNVVEFVRRYGFDGLDIDWEYPAARGGTPADKENLVTLCRELFEAFTFDAAERGVDRLLLTAAVPANPETAANGYNVPSLSRYFDFVSLMTYDFHGGWDRKTGFNSPLYGAINDFNPSFNMDAAARWWHQAGMPKNKMNIGMATYGRSFTLTNPHNHGVGATARTGPAGPVTREQGFWSYYEICLDIKRGGGHVVFDGVQKVPYYVKGSLWIGYDNEQSLRIKAEWLKSNNYGGVMFWALDLDDFNQVCTPASNRKYPLIRAVIDVLDDNEVDVDSGTSTRVSTTSPTTTATTSLRTTFTTTASPNNRPGATEPFSCSGKTTGLYPDPADCNRFYWCVEWGNFSMTCSPSQVWDARLRTCNNPNVVDMSNCVYRQQ